MSTQTITETPKAQFHMRRAAADSGGYYHTRWDKAVPMVVIASNEREAINKADAFSGEATRGKYWTFLVDRIEELHDQTESDPQP